MLVPAGATHVDKATELGGAAQRDIREHPALLRHSSSQTNRWIIEEEDTDGFADCSFLRGGSGRPATQPRPHCFRRSETPQGPARRSCGLDDRRSQYRPWQTTSCLRSSSARESKKLNGLGPAGHQKSLTYDSVACFDASDCPETLAASATCGEVIDRADFTVRFRNSKARGLPPRRGNTRSCSAHSA